MGTLIKSFFKAIANFAKKALIRKSNVFGISGSIKAYGGLRKAIQNKKTMDLIKKIAKKNVLRAFHGTNFIFNLKKFGWQESLKRAAKNRLVPMEIRKLGWFYNGLKNEYGREKLIKEWREQVLVNANKKQVKITNKDGIKQIKNIDDIMKFKPKNNGEKDLRNEVKNKTIVFNVNSPETHNFSQRFHFYNLATKDYDLPIRGWKGTRIKYYTYYNVPWVRVKEALLKLNYGRVVFSEIR